MMRRIRTPRGVTAIEYALLILVFVAALVGMSVYMKRAVCGQMRDRIDNTFGHGRQYAP